MESSEISERSGLSLTQVEAISYQLDWRGVDVPSAKSFLAACEIDFSSRDQMKRVSQRLTKKLRTPGGRFAYLKESANYDRYFAPLLARFYRSISK